MNAADERTYRRRLAEGFLAEARQDATLQRWRSCVDNSQLAAENAAKTALAMLGPVGRTHSPAGLLRRALQSQKFSPDVRRSIERLAECAEFLGPDIHARSDYGDEVGGLTPWELFDENAARQALALAEEAVSLASSLP